MATKINTDFYGAENTFANVDNNGNIKHAASTLWDLLNAGTYTGGSLEQSAAPWGMGRSSASSLYCFAAANESGAYSRKDWYNDKGNTPMYMYYRSTIAQGDIDGNGDIANFTTSALNGTQIKKGLQTARYNLTTAGASDALNSTLSEDSGDNVNYAYCSTLYPVTYADYAKIRIRCGAVCYIPEGRQTIEHCSIEDIINNNVSVKNIVGFLAYFTNTDNRTTYHYVYPTGGGSELPVPEGHKTYYGNDGRVQPWRRIDTMGFFCSYNWYSFGNNEYPNFNISAMPPASAFDDITTFDPQFTTLTSLNMYNWGHVSPKKQVFDDVSYHWEVGIVPYSIDYQNFDVLADGATLTGTGYRIAGKLVIDDSTYNTTNEAVTAAIMHELAFIGFPVAKTYTDSNAAIGTSGILLPVFDEHLITTGEFVSGSDSLNLPNATWRDVFGATMPEYDPNYDPDPEPDEGDTGDLSNTGAPRQPPLFGEITFYAMTGLEFYQFVKEVNAYYIGKTPDDWTLDFQGVNPAEYILGVYFTYFDLPIGDTPYSIDIGTITLPNVTAYKVDEGDTMLRPNRWQYCDFGTLAIDSKYGDFRDYPPYTTMELYLPLAGTIDIDSNYFIGHNISITYYYNILTMTGVACVYRDNLLYKTVDLKIASQIPLLSTNIGQYQNQIAQLANTREQNTIRLTAGALSTAAGLGATIATGGAALPALIAAGTGVATMATGAIKQDEISYQIEHTSPSLSVTGAAEANNALCCGQLMPKLIIKRAAMLPHDDAIYAQTVGNACCINDIIGKMSGLTVCSKIDATGITATADEIQAIKQAFANGVIV